MRKKVKNRRKDKKVFSSTASSTNVRNMALPKRGGIRL